MQCRYCGEVIKDDAVVCRYCRQNVSVLEGAIASYEKKLSRGAYETVHQLSRWYLAKLLASRLVAQETKPMRITIGVLLPGLLLATALESYTLLEWFIQLEIAENVLIMRRISNPVEWIGVALLIQLLAFVWLVAPVPCGFIAGLNWQGRGPGGTTRLRIDLLLSTIAGVFTFVCITLGNLIVLRAPFKVPGSAPSWNLEGEIWSVRTIIVAFLLVVVVPLLQFLSGLFFSDLVKSWGTKPLHYSDTRFRAGTGKQLTKALSSYLAALATIATALNQLLALGSSLK